MANNSPRHSRHPGRQAEVPSGTYLLHGKGDRQLTDVTVTRYRLEVDGGVESYWDRTNYTASVAYYLDQTHGTPVASAGTLSVISMTELNRSVEVWGKRVTPVETEQMQLDPAQAGDREMLKRFVQSCFRRAVPTDAYSCRFLNEVTRHEAAFSGESFAAHPKHSVKVQIADDGVVLTHVESGYAIRSTSSLEALYSPGEDLPQAKAAHHTERYHVPGQGWLEGWSDLTYTDYLEEAGARLADIHEGKADEQWRQRLIEQNPRLVKIRYGQNVRNHVPHFLKLSPRVEQVKDEDSGFFTQFIDRRAMMPDEKFEYALEFFENLAPLPVLDLTFEPGPTNHSYERIPIRDQHRRLVFSNGHRATTPSQGLRDYGAYKNPGTYRVGVLAPDRWSDLNDELMPLLVHGLAELDAPAHVTGYTYELGDVSNYTPVAHDIHTDTDAVVAVVPDKGAAANVPGVEDPHHELKRTLIRQEIPTQMLRKPTLQELVNVRAGPAHDKMLNILSALIAKAGGTPWQLHELPGDTDAFMGLDVSRDEASGQHSGASASVVLADGTTFAAESTVQQSGETFAPKHLQQFIRDLVFDFAAEQGHTIDRLCIMRDGKVQEDFETVRAGLTELDADIDIVGIRKNGQPRVADFDGTRFRIAEKGIGFVDESRDQAIIHASGKPEIRDDNAVGTPQTFGLMRHSGETTVETLARQAYWLSEVHVGSPVRSPRLPIPIGYADKAAEYVRKGIVSPGTVIKGPAYL